MRTAAGSEVGGRGRRVEPRFRVDQKPARGGHPITFVQPLEHRIELTLPWSEFDFHALELAGLPLDVHHLFHPGIDNGPFRHFEKLISWQCFCTTGAGKHHPPALGGHALIRLDVFQRRVDPHRGEHAGPQLTPRVVELEPNAVGAGRRFQFRVDACKLAAKGSIGIRLDGGFDLLTDFEKRDIPLVHVGLDPHRGEVGHLEQRHLGLDAGAGHDLLGHHVSGLRRANHQSRRRLPGLRDAVDLLLTDAQEQELVPRRGHQIG